MILGWTQTELADQAAIAKTTVWNFERKGKEPQRSTLKLIRETFEAHGIIFDPPVHGHEGEASLELCVLSDGSRVRRKPT